MNDLLELSRWTDQAAANESTGVSTNGLWTPEAAVASYAANESAGVDTNGLWTPEAAAACMCRGEATKIGSAAAKAIWRRGWVPD